MGAGRYSRTFRGVKPIRFWDVDDIRRKLGLAAGPAPTLNPGASPFIPSQAHAQANDARTSAEAPTEESSYAGDPIDEEEEDTVSPPEVINVAMIESIETKVTMISEEDLAKQNAAAKTLQLYYRRLQASRVKNRIAGLGLPKTRKDRFAAFAQAADSMEGLGRPRYRCIFLGALPHLLVCLDYSWTIVMDDKAKARRAARSNGRHQVIEDVMKQKTRLNDIIKRIERLQVVLKETSDVHKRQDLKELEIYVGQVAAILDVVPQAMKALEFDMAMASSWIAYVNGSRKAKVDKKRPELNTEDLDSLEYF